MQFLPESAQKRLLFLKSSVILLLLVSGGALFVRSFFNEYDRGGVNMSRVCSVCNKGQNSGNNVSHSNRKTRRTFKANVQKVRIVKDGKVESAYVCARCLKSDKVERA